MAAPLTPSTEWRFPNRATPPGSSAYYSLRFAPVPLRDSLALLLAWRHGVQAVARECSDPGVARLKLGWWREELERLMEGAPRHPLTQGLAPVVARWGLPAGPFAAMIEGAESDLFGARPEDLEDLEARCRRDLGGLFELLGRCHGVGTDDGLERLRGLGAGCALVYLIRDLGAPHHQGRYGLPRALGAPDGRPTQGEPADAALLHSLASLADHARALLRENREGAPACLTARGAILAKLLDTLENSNFPVLTGRVGLTPWYKLWIAWRASRNAGFQLP